MPKQGLQKGLHDPVKYKISIIEQDRKREEKGSQPGHVKDLGLLRENDILRNAPFLLALWDGSDNPMTRQKIMFR